MGMVNSDEFTMVNAFQGDFRGVVDTVLLVLDADGEVKLSSYLGGTQMDNPRGLIVADGKVHLVGDSTSPDFYTTNDAFQEVKRGQSDGFIFTLELESYLQNVDDIQVPDSARINPISNITYYASFGLVAAAIIVYLLLTRRYFSSR